VRNASFDEQDYPSLGIIWGDSFQGRNSLLRQGKTGDQTFEDTDQFSSKVKVTDRKLCRTPIPVFKRLKKE
jgi:hypothetical protein